MELDKLKKAKISAIETIMNNKDLFSVVKDALKSPIGSKKRKKGADLLSSIGKSFGVQNLTLQGFSAGDGKGGVPISGGVNSGVLLGSAPSMNVQKAVTGNINPIKMSDLTPKNQTSVTLPGVTPAATTPAATTTGTEQPAAPGTIFKSIPGTGTNVSTTTTTTDTTGTIDLNQQYNDWYNALSKNDQTKYGGLYKALTSGIGADMFTDSTLSNKEELKRLFPDWPEEYLPTGPSIDRQIKDLENKLRGEYKLDLLAGNINKLENAGVSFEDNLTDFITTKDKYIKDIDNILDKTRGEYINSAQRGDPAYENSMKRYSTYLTLMKAKQQKRYSDFVSDAVKQNTLELNSLKNDYTTQKSMFDSAFESKKLDAKENFETVKNEIKNLYIMMETKQDRLLKALDLNNKINDATTKIVETTLEAKDGLTGLKTDNQKKIAKTFEFIPKEIIPEIESLIPLADEARTSKMYTDIKAQYTANPALNIKQAIIDWNTANGGSSSATTEQTNLDYYLMNAVTSSKEITNNSTKDPKTGKYPTKTINIKTGIVPESYKGRIKKLIQEKLKASGNPNWDTILINIK